MKPRRRFSSLQGLITAALAAVWLSAPLPTSADVPSLQVAPLEYDSTLTPGHVSTGYVDVSNPADSTDSITSSVRGFRQTGQNGDLQFFDDPDLSAAIQVGLPSFDLGPREAIRVVFSVDAGKLPAGGTYAALFFRTNPPAQSSNNSYIAQSANVGTLLLLTNGTGSTKHGRITGASLGFWQFGTQMTGTYTYQNTDHTARPVGFRPQVSARVLPWGHHQAAGTGLVLPGATRQLAFTRTGSFVGLLPFTLTDADTGSHLTMWVLACTGWYRLVVPLLVLAAAAIWLWSRKRRP